MEGFEKGEICNREGCYGIIDQHTKEGACSCHINPPCGYCEHDPHYCPVCEWNAEEEKRLVYKNSLQEETYKKNQEYYKQQREEFDKQRELFYKKYSGEIPVDKLEYRRESHTHFSMKVIGIFPPGITQEEIRKQVRGTFGGRFTQFGKHSFEYIAYTD